MQARNNAICVSVARTRKTSVLCPYHSPTSKTGFSATPLLPEDHRENSTGFLTFSFIAVGMNSRDQYEIMGFHEISHSIKQPGKSVYLKRTLEMH